MPPTHEIAHPAHVELRTPVPEESLEFFTSYLGHRHFSFAAKT